MGLKISSMNRLSFRERDRKGGIHWETTRLAKQIRQRTGGLSQHGQDLDGPFGCPYPSHCCSTRPHLQPLPGPILFPV